MSTFSRQIFFILAVLASLCQPIYAKKNLVLILSSENLPVYKVHKESWRLYMHAFEEDFESYFLQYDDSLDGEFLLEGDTLWMKGKESIIPGCMEKTAKAFKYFSNRKDEFDYIIRPNLSSFIVLPRLKDFLKNKPKTRFYAGNKIDFFISGACIILSTDLMESISSNNPFFQDYEEDLDDVQIGYFLVGGMSIQPFHHPNHQFIKSCRPKKIAPFIPKEIFHFRIKCPYNRERVERIIHNDLLNIFYPTIMMEKKLKKRVFS